MSSFTSSSKKSKPWRWFFGALIGATLLLLGAGAFNFVVDPFARRASHEIDFDRRTIHRNFSIPLWSLFSVQRISDKKLGEAEVVVLGDSRATLLTNDGEGFRTKEVEGRQVLNLSLGGGSLEENISFYQIEERRARGFPHLKKLIFTVPFNRICEPEKSDRIRQSEPMLHNPFLYYFNGYVSKRSLLSISRMGKTVAESGKMLTADDDRKVLANWVATYRSYNPDLADERVAMLSKFSENMAGRGVEVIFYLPPGGGSGEKIVGGLGLSEEFSEYKAQLEVLGRLADWSDESGVAGRPFLYLPGDPIHHDQGVEIMRKILE